MEKKPTFKVGYTTLPDPTSRKEFKFAEGPSTNDFNIIHWRDRVSYYANDSAYRKVPKRYYDVEDSFKIVHDYLEPSIPSIIKGAIVIENDRCILEINPF